MPKGGPDGGDGGNGGSVFIQGDGNLNTLIAFSRTRRFAASNGSNGSSGLKHGENGSDVIIKVPLGTGVWVDGRRPQLLADVDGPGPSVMVAAGGRGGRGNAGFATSTNRFPLLAEAGEAGEEKTLRLELKLLADVGIVGAPNAGKSSLLAAVTRARPKIAEYPFTTLEPYLGVVDWRDSSFVMVDIPGLIEGAHEGVGLGMEFLRHIERTNVLVHVVDAAADDAEVTYRQINEELEQHDKALLQKPQIVMLNKTDIPGVLESVGALQSGLSDLGIQVRSGSAATGDGVDSLLDAILQTLELTRETTTAKLDEAPPPQVPVLTPQPRRVATRVSVTDGAYVVDMQDTTRIAAMVNMDDWNARMQFYDLLRRRGVIKALEQAGISTGDTVRFGTVAWEWE